MTVDLHNHTPLCNHAVGEPLEFVRCAIKAGTRYFGFSDHAPMNYDEAYRMKFEEMQSYEDEILRLRDEFSGEIEILLGYEMDFLDGFMDERVFTRKVDYLIGSVHFFNGWAFDNPEFIGGYEGKDLDKIWQEYFDHIERSARLGKFDIMGHIDLLKLFKFLPKKDVRVLAKNAVKAIKEANLVVEINAAGFRKPIGEQYPSVNLLELIAENDITITFGSDAHAKEDIGKNGEICEQIARNLGYSKCAIFKSRDRELVKF